MSDCERGIAYLVGAGPGALALMTRRGFEVLRRADVVLYDFLVSEDILAAAPAGAERICVGKRAHGHTLPQVEIGRLMRDRVAGGQTVVRLKGGDPFVFGRGGEEARELAESGLRFEIVPGITAGIAAPAYAGIPVTHRNLSGGVVLVTGHEDPNKGRSDVDWRSLAASGLTLCVYMGVGHLAQICSALRKGGRRGTEPAALVELACTPQQRTVTGNLADLPERARTAGVRPPAMLVVGEGVKLRRELRWREAQPLFGRTILVPGPGKKAERLRDGILNAGGRALSWRAFEMAYDARAGRNALELLRSDPPPDWLVVSSPGSVDGLKRALASAGKDVRRLNGIRVAALGAATARALAALGIRADARLHSEMDVARALVGGDARLMAGRSVAVLRSAETRPALLKALDEMGADTHEFALGRVRLVREMDSGLKQALLSGDVDGVALTSASVARGFGQSVGSELRSFTEMPARPRVYSSGSATTAGLLQFGLRPDVEIGRESGQGLLSVLLGQAEVRR